ncbi:MAG: DUF6273 domain-containing protein [Clostridium sp.]
MKKICAKILIMALVLQSVYLTINVTNESAKAATLNLHNPTMVNGVSTWDCVYFGTYWQNDTNGDGVADQNDAKEPIKWRVLQVDGDDVFLMSDKNLDCQKYNNNEVDVTWETCSLRAWLFSNFYRRAFSTAEQNAIKVTTVVNDKNEVYGTSGGKATEDKVYIPSIKEISNTKYGFDGVYSNRSNTRAVKNTVYTAQRCKTKEYGAWWLRTPGANRQQAALVDGWGYVYGGKEYSGLSVTKEFLVVCPVMHISISSALGKLELAGTVSSDGIETTPEVTSTPTPILKPTSTPAPTQMSAIVPEITPTADVTSKTTIIPTVTPNPTAKATKNPQKETIASALPNKTANNTLARSTVKMGKIFNDKGINYKITKLTEKKGKLTLISVKNKKTKKVTIPKEVKKYGYKFTITQISKNVFTRCKKLKQLTIKSRTITKIGKNKFPKKCKIVVPQVMKKRYIKLLKKWKR